MVKVIMEAQQYKDVFCYCESLEDANYIIELHAGEFEDENGFIWSLEIEEED